MGNPIDEFTFTRRPRKALTLPTHNPIGITATRSTPPAATCSSSTVSWVQPTNPNITQASTYRIWRDGVELPRCVGTATTCVDPPTPGPHSYRSYAINSAGVQSPELAAAEADTPAVTSSRH